MSRIKKHQFKVTEKNSERIKKAKHIAGVVTENVKPILNDVKPKVLERVKIIKSEKKKESKKEYNNRFKKKEFVTKPKIEKSKFEKEVELWLYNMITQSIEMAKDKEKNGESIKQQIERVSKKIIEEIKPIIDLISDIRFADMDLDFNEDKIDFYKNVFKENENIIDELYKDTIFPPIKYLIRNDIEEKNILNFDKWILEDKSLKKFYMECIERWKRKYNDENIKKMIGEIKVNFKRGNSYSICTLIAILIEYMLKQNCPEKIKHSGGIYKSIKAVLNEKVFMPIDIEKFYIKFIEENLYASTDKAEVFSRHITHGENIELADMKAAMNMIFLYDFIQDIMIVNKKQSEKEECI